MTEETYSIDDALDVAEPGWRLLPMPRSFGAGRSFVSGDLEGERLRVYYYQRESDLRLIAKVWFGLDAEGPPGHAHGGSMAAVLDEAMGFSAWVAGHSVVAANISISFRKRLPLEVTLLAEGWIHAHEAGRVVTHGRIWDPRTGRVFAEGEGLFVEQPLESFGELGATVRKRREAGA